MPRFPEVVNLMTVRGCNATCSFCPHKTTEAQRAGATLPDDRLVALFEELAEHRVGRLNFQTMNEPFLDRRLVDKARLAREYLPYAHFHVTTNGSVFTKRVVDEILTEPVAFDSILVSFHGVDAQVYEESMGLDFERTVQCVERLVGERERRGLAAPVVRASVLNTGDLDIEEARGFWRQRGVEVHSGFPDNRGGLVDKGLFPNLRWRPNSECLIPYQHCYIQADGDVLMCCADYEKTVILGNVLESSLSEVWNGDFARSVRERFYQRDPVQICKDCDIAYL